MKIWRSKADIWQYFMPEIPGVPWAIWGVWTMIFFAPQRTPDGSHVLPGGPCMIMSGLCGIAG